jgi:lipopolysaccharide/colanic/teichoic acid biosynthesis glycosyltransferase
LKRAFDILVAFLAIVILSPLILCIAVAVRIVLGKPVLFTQVRPGRWGRPFTVIKFRTMHNACDHKGEALPDAQRVTKFGMFLRSSSLDELPELWNVLTGEMSLVGPRPLLMEYLPLYSPQEARRHDVRPGMTGWAQINGRNAITWSEKFNLDVWYVDNQSFLLDLKILILTIVKVFRRDGISAADNVTMPKFGSGPR